MKVQRRRAACPGAAAGRRRAARWCPGCAPDNRRRGVVDARVPLAVDALAVAFHLELLQVRRAASVAGAGRTAAPRASPPRASSTYQTPSSAEHDAAGSSRAVPFGSARPSRVRPRATASKCSESRWRARSASPINNHRNTAPTQSQTRTCISRRDAERAQLRSRSSRMATKCWRRRRHILAAQDARADGT